MNEDQDQVTPEEVETPVEEQPQEQQTTEAEAKPVEPAQETEAQINYRAMRELKKKAEQERDVLLQKLQLAEQKQQPKQETPPQQDFSIAPDDLVEGKHLSAVDKKVKQLESQLQSYQQQSAAQNIEARIKTQYPDFDQVVSKDNLEIFRTAYPDLATAIGSSTDLYSKATSAYKLIKKYNIHQHKEVAKGVDRVQSNLSKPVPTASLGSQQGDSPLSKANAFSGGLTAALKEQLLKEMNEAIKNK